jgi:polyferredoxin
MTGESSVRVLGIEFTTRKLLLLLGIAVLSLHPFVFAATSPEPYVLALPWWYFADLGVLIVIYALIRLYLGESLIADQSTAEMEGER